MPPSFKLLFLGPNPVPAIVTNQLMELFDYQSFYITAKFLKNCNIIIWCMNLIQKQKNEVL